MAFEIIEDMDSWERQRDLRFVTHTSKEFHSVDLPEEWDQEYEPDDTFDAEYLNQKMGEMVQISPSEFTQFAVMMPDKATNSYKPFSFKDRRYLKPIYDTNSKNVLLKCGRQVEKSCRSNTYIRLFNGSPILAGDVKVGDWLATLSEDASHMSYGQVAWVSQRYTKPCVRITTRQGHTVEVALTHPMRTWDAWTDAGGLKVKDRIAAVRKCGIFQQQWAPEKHRIRLTAYLIGDGCIGGDHEGNISFTQMPGPVLNEFCADVVLSGGSYLAGADSRSKAWRVTLHEDGNVRGWMRHDDLENTTSHTKFAPYWVWGLSKEDAALFLNRLWSTDGHVKQNTRSKYSLEYCSVSPRLIKDVQALLWKFGIPSSIRKNWPNYWKDQGIEQYAYILRVETQEGVRRFLTEISCLGKSEDVVLPLTEENNNRDTYPIEINSLLRRIIDSRGSAGRMGRFAEKDKSLRTAGLRETLKYPPTWQKLQQYVDFFKSDTRYDQRLVTDLEKHIDTDLYWDEIEKIEDIGEQECVDFEVEGTHNFVAEGLVTHNSTMLGNKLLSYSCINTALNSLYVSPTNQQTKVFSQDRLKEPIETSPYLKSWTTTKLSDNVFLKKFINRSQVTLRYAYLNADRCRGIPADIICLDELQDLLTDNIPVIEECASHSVLMINGEEHKGGLFMYSGTPKSLDNTIEYYWTNYSTQNEWAVPCHRHTISLASGKMSKVYWNILSEDHIGPESLICDKCHKPIFAADEMSQWVSLNADIIKKIPRPYDGYRIPQLMVPWIGHADLIQKQRTYPRARFHNEVLGISYDSGTRPLTRQDVVDNCDDRLLLTDEYQAKIRAFIGGAYPVYAGLDWGTGEKTFTVLSLGSYMGDDKFTIFYVHRFEGRESEPQIQIDEISRYINMYNIQLVGCDYGGGFWPNDELTRKFGFQRIVKYQYSMPSTKVMWQDGLKRFLVHRSEVMSDIFNAIKRRNVFRFPGWDGFQFPYGTDMLNIFSEYSEQIRQNVYKKSPNSTDDTFHSVLNCFLVSMIRHPRPDVISPMAANAVAAAA